VNDAKYIGLDVHQATISATVLDSTSKQVMEAILETKAETILQFIRGLRGSLHVTFEEGTSAAWLHDLLKPHVTQALVCDPRKNALLKAGNKNDRIDARKLAELLCLNKLNSVYHGEAGVRTLKESARSYLTITRDLTRVMSRLKAIYRSWAIPCADEQVYAPRYRAEWLAKNVHESSGMKSIPSGRSAPRRSSPTSQIDSLPAPLPPTHSQAPDQRTSFSLARRRLLDESGRGIRIHVGTEPNDGRISSPNYLRHEERHVYSRSRDGLCDGEPQSGLIVPFHKQRGDRRGRKSRFRSRSSNPLARDRVEFNRRAGFIARIPIPHQQPQVRPGLRNRIKRACEHPNFVLNLFPPKRNVFHRNLHGSASREVSSRPDETNTTPTACELPQTPSKPVVAIHDNTIINALEEFRVLGIDFISLHEGLTP